MPKKRLIFTLLFDSESQNFCLSRNFSLQKVGNLSWLKKNYNFSNVSKYIDELIILEVSRESTNTEVFNSVLKILSSECFIPVAAGGNIKTINDAKNLFLSGADKIVINSALFDSPELIKEISQEFGKQSIIGSFDLKKEQNQEYKFFTKKGSKKEIIDPIVFFKSLSQISIGEIYLNSIDKDGTGQDFDYGILKLLPANFNLPLIMAGGAGHTNHLIKALENEKIDAASTAHLFNFMGDILKKSRQKASDKGLNLASWSSNF